MSFLAVVFVVLMLFWLLCGVYGAYNPGPGPWLYGNALIPWLCVAIIGYVVLAGGGATVVVR